MWKSARIIHWALTLEHVPEWFNVACREMKHNYIMYADDHQLHVKGTNHEMVRQQLKTSSKQALIWYSINLLSANPEKFQLLNINPRKIDGDTSDAVLSLDGLPIDKSEDVKLLGVHIDDNLD